MGVSEPHQVHQALDRAVFPRRAMERIEHHIRRGFGKHLRNIPAHIDPRDLVSTLFQRSGDFVAAHQRDRALV